MRLKLGYIVLLLFLIGCSKTDSNVMTKSKPKSIRRRQIMANKQYV